MMRFDSELLVDLKYLKSNIELLRKDYLKKNTVIFMVKANAYGHGIAEIVGYAVEECGIDHFGVATLAEAIFLREQLARLDFHVWVFSELNLFNDDVSNAYHEHNISPVISRLEDLEQFVSIFSHLPLVLKFNTGMNRLGIDESNLDKVLSLLRSHNVSTIFHLMTHFSSSYLPLKKSDRTHQQYANFLEIKRKIEEAGFTIESTSVSNSGAIEQKFGLDETHVRPGLMLYGPSSLMGESRWKGKIISRLKTQVINIRHVAKGTPVGYGGHICHADGFIVYLPIGYGDGVLTYYSGLELEVHGKPAKFIGRVNMDIAQLYFKELPSQFQIGSEIEIWNDTQSSILNIVKHTKTIPYQLFTSISARVSRRYNS